MSSLSDNAEHQRQESSGGLQQSGIQQPGGIMGHEGILDRWGDLDGELEKYPLYPRLDGIFDTRLNAHWEKMQFTVYLWALC